MVDAAPLKLDPASTALVLIDLQKGIVARPSYPYSGTEVVSRAAALTAKFRARGATVVLVHVVYSPDGKDRLRAPIDAPPVAIPATPDFGEIMPELGRADTDIVITKRQWGAFYGTELDLQLRRRGVRTLVLGGISTNMASIGAFGSLQRKEISACTPVAARVRMSRPYQGCH